MINKKALLTFGTVCILLLSSLGVFTGGAVDSLSGESQYKNRLFKDFDFSSVMAESVPSAIEVSDSNPFYALIATPLAIHYSESGEQSVVPLYVKDLDNPSGPVLRAEEEIGFPVDFVISDAFSPKQWSLSIAELFWVESDAVLLVEDSFEGYSLAVAATPLASYLSIPVIVTDDVDIDVEEVLDSLGVETILSCGSLSVSSYEVVDLSDAEMIASEVIDLVDSRFGSQVNYVTLTNPLDTIQPEVLDSVTEEFSGEVGSISMIPTQLFNMVLKGAMSDHTFVVPSDYKYAKLTFDLENLDADYVDNVGDRLSFMLYDPEGTRIAFDGTHGGISVRDEEGNLLEDRLTFSICMYDKPGEYSLSVFANYFAVKTGQYDLTVTVEKLDSLYVPLMDGLSSFAPYYTSYHQGVVYAKSDFAFAADDGILSGGETCPGVSQAGVNYPLIEPANEFTKEIHEQLHDLFYEITDIDEGDVVQLREFCIDNPFYISIAADPTMVPMYFYYNPDGEMESPGADFLGYALPSDFIYATVDPDPADMENDTQTFWPYMENIVARTTGRNAQDLSALIARTIYYDILIEGSGDWKHRALVQTGCGLEFQNLPIMTKLSQLIYSGRGEPTKFFTGESTFINLRLEQMTSTGYDLSESTFALASQREGFSREDLSLIKKSGLLNRLLFPSLLLTIFNGEDKVVGGQKQMDSNLIFTFAHGSFNLYEHGDVFIDSRGFPGLTWISRYYPTVRSSLSCKGTFEVRAVDDMEYGPSVIFVLSCITGRTDGLDADNVLSQAYIHAGVNAYIGATRVTADPGYLEPRPLPGGWGFGILGLMNASWNLAVKGEYPQTHFGSVIAEDFIDDLIQNDSSTGLALRNAKNKFLPKDANSTFLWTPPLSLALTGNPIIDQEIDQLRSPQPVNERTRTLDKKYVCLHEFTLYGDPAFNPYQSVNNG